MRQRREITNMKSVACNYHVLELRLNLEYKSRYHRSLIWVYTEANN